MVLHRRSLSQLRVINLSGISMCQIKGSKTHECMSAVCVFTDVGVSVITCPDLRECLGDRLPVLLREFMLPWEGVERSESFGGGGLAGSPGIEPATEPRLFFLLDRGMRAEGRSAGTGSFSRARYTRCMAWGSARCRQCTLTAPGVNTLYILRPWGIITGGLGRRRSSPLRTRPCPGGHLYQCHSGPKPGSK